MRCLVPALLLVAAAGVRAESPSFEKDIQPLLQAKCAKCHSEKARKAELDLSTPAGIAKGGESGPVVVAGKPEKSLLYEKVHSGEMPPKKDERLSAKEIDTLKAWIEAGAKTTAVAKAESISQHDVYPIFLRRCTVCHGRNRQEGASIYGHAHRLFAAASPVPSSTSISRARACFSRRSPTEKCRLAIDWSKRA